MTVALPAARDCQLSILVENKNAVSVPAVIRLHYSSAATTAPAAPAASAAAGADLLKPKLYVLAVGVGKYANLPGASLTYPATDARAFVAAMQRQKGGLYRDVEVKLLTDEQATRDDIADGLDWLQHQTTARDVAMAFFAGHGANDDTRVYHFLPYNFDPTKFKRTGVARSDIDSTLKEIAGKVFLFLDTCDSGNVLGTTRARSRMGVDITELVNALAAADSGVVVYCASNRFQDALEDPAWGDGAFTKALVEGLTGDTDPKLPPGADSGALLQVMRTRGKVTIATLEAYLAERVKELTKGRQTPVSTKPETIPDLPLAAMSAH